MLPERILAATSRRGFFARAGRLLLATSGGSAVAAALKVQDADAYHFCGHIYTTASCPHPTGLPRVDANGFPLRAADGKAVDDLGRPVDADGYPVNDAGARLLDSDGNPLPPTSRTRVCDATATRFGFKPHVDGAWYRCCGGRIRRLVDCCGHVEKRINGDAALTGYCYAGRKVFCVTYFDSKIPC